MTYTLAHTSPSRVFATCETINARSSADAVSLAIAPRELRIIEGKPCDMPMLNGYIFLAMPDEEWHNLDRLPCFHRPHAVQQINPRQWEGLRGFFERAEASYQRAMDKWENGDFVAKLRKGDRVQIIGDAPLYGLLGAAMGQYISRGADGVRIQLDGPGMMGKPVVRVVSQDSIQFIG